MTMITPSYLGETIEYSSLHACRSTLEDPTITAGNASEVYAAGADSVAVIRDLALATDAARQVRRFLAIAERSITRRS